MRRGPLAADVRWRDGRYAEQHELEFVHDSAYIQDVRDRIAAGGGRVAPTTTLSAASWRGLTAAAGTTAAAARRC